MKKIKVRVKKEKPSFKGVDICQTFLKGFAENVKKYGEIQYFYKYHHSMSNDVFFVGVIEYGDKNYFLVERNYEIISCTEM